MDPRNVDPDEKPTEEQKLECGCIIYHFGTKPAEGEKHIEGYHSKRSWCIPCALIVAGQTLIEASKGMAHSGQMFQVAGEGLRTSQKAWEAQQDRPKIIEPGPNVCQHGNNRFTCIDCKIANG